MPTYVYECSACSTVFEIEQRITEDALDTCVPCGSKGTVKRLIQPVGIAFKGSGFHINDYSGKSFGGDSTKAEIAGAPASTGEPAAATSETKAEPAKSEPTLAPKPD